MPSKRSGFLITSSFGVNGNLEVVVASNRGGFYHFWRDNDSPGFPWNGPTLFGCSALSAPSLIQNDGGPLEVFATAGGRIAAYNRGERWKGPKYFGEGVSGNPAVIQTDSGRLHLVVPAEGNGFAYFQRAADPAAAWEAMPAFGEGAGHAKSVALLQGNFNDPGNLEMMAVLESAAGSTLAHFWQDGAGQWFGPNIVQIQGLPLGAFPVGAPAFLQSRHGTQGHFEVVVPLSTGGLAHVRRDNDSTDHEWKTLSTFGSGTFAYCSMFQGNFGTPGLGNFELVGLVDGRLEHYWCDDQTLTWTGPSAVVHSEPVTTSSTSLGEWRIEHICEPVGIHAALLKTNRIVFFAYEEQNQFEGVSSVFNPEDGSVVHVEQSADLFCAGHAFLPDGRLLVAGGHVTGEKALFIFEPSGSSGTWHRLPDMPEGRWYPTCTTLPDGTIFVLSGAKKTGGGPVNDTYQIFHPTSGLGPQQPAPFMNEVGPCDTYPWVFVLPSGKLSIYSFNRLCFFDLATKTFGPERIFTNRQEPRTYPLEGTCVLLPLLPDSNPPYRPRVMVIGGGGMPPEDHTPATNTCEIIDLSEASPKWKNTPPMPAPRVMPDSVLLPDGTVLVMNGSFAGKADHAVNPVYGSEIYNPETNAWTQTADLRVPRLYHSTALLLPDATVMTAGLDEAFNPHPFHYPEYRLEIFKPPYLFKGDRPVVHSAPSGVTYGQAFDVQCADPASIQKAALLRAGSVTHSFNMDQRHVGLKITSRSGTAVKLEAPPNGNIAPPGVYLLFLLNGQGVPSMGQFISLT